MIGKRGRKSYYLDFLALICQFKGQGIPSKQHALCRHLFAPAPHLLQNDNNPLPQVITSLDNPMTLNRKILYNLRCERNPNGTLGELEIQIPESDLWVTLLTLIHEERTHSQYFLSTIRLLAALCSSRNYMCMYSMERFFPQQMLVDIIKDTAIANEVVHHSLCLWF